MRKEWVSYYIYKFYKLIAAVIIIVILNFLDSWLIDLFIVLFGNMEELQGLIATLALTLVVSVVLFTALFLLALRLRSRIFPVVPVKPGTAAASAKTSRAGHPLSQETCHCACGTSRDMLGTVRFQLPGGEEALLSMNVVKREDGNGLLRSDCKVAGKTQSVAFRINFCPKCGGQFAVEEKPEEVVKEIVTRPAPAESKKRVSRHLA